MTQTACDCKEAVTCEDTREGDRDPLLTPIQAAHLLRVTTRTVARWATDGTLPVEWTTPGGHRRYAKSTVEGLRETMRGA